MVGNNFWISNVKVWLERDYPNLKNTTYQITSPDTLDYNCIAWAAGDTTKWWWPDQDFIHYWPPNVPREETLEAFILMFETLGYQVFLQADFESGWEKIAIYAKNDKPRHAARQLPNGKWTSKIGQYEDIEHDSLMGLEGDLYGQVVCLMRRSIS